MKTIGIIGGMGPLATVDLFKKIVQLTNAKRDQDHIHVIIDSNPETPDRTEFILANGENPEPYLLRSALRLEFCGADVLIMACNTAHYFIDNLRRHVHIPFLSMIEETAKEIKKGTPPVQSVGLLATSGTCQAGVYDKVFEQYGINLLKPTPNLQDLVMRLIYYIKSDGSSTYDPSEIRIVLESLKQAGAETYILGCTELPVAFEMLDICEATIDPTEIIAKSAIRFVGKNI
jgi:aspartate racemase